MRITLRTIRALKPCYDPEEVGFDADMSLTPLEFIDRFRDKVKNKGDILWLLCRTRYMSERDLRLFAVWCAREALAEAAARGAAGDAVWAAWAAGEAAARGAARAAARAAWAARGAAWAAGEAQIDKLRTYFDREEAS